VRSCQSHIFCAATQEERCSGFAVQLSTEMTTEPVSIQFHNALQSVSSRLAEVIVRLRKFEPKECVL
jgi:hypothetical protein